MQIQVYSDSITVRGGCTRVNQSEVNCSKCLVYRPKMHVCQTWVFVRQTMDCRPYGIPYLFICNKAILLWRRSRCRLPRRVLNAISGTSGCRRLRRWYAIWFAECHFPLVVLHWSNLLRFWDHCRRSHGFRYRPLSLSTESQDTMSGSVSARRYIQPIHRPILCRFRLFVALCDNNPPSFQALRL